MVKNTGGGKGNKKMARKLVAAPRNHRLRLSTDDAELYACVGKLLGNGMAHVTTADGVPMLLHIRNKFRGRSKRDNTIRPGSVVLIGERTFESERAGKLANCDLLEVYNDSEVKRLREDTFIDFSAFKELSGFNPTTVEEDTTFAFGDEKNCDNDIDKEIADELACGVGVQRVPTETIDVSGDDELDIDDI
jgi:initiation factor 1A